MGSLSLLSRPEILRHKNMGDIVIDPFNQENLGTVSYDVVLGPWFYRETNPSGRLGLLNPYDDEHIERIWGIPQKALEARLLIEELKTPLVGIRLSDRIILIAPGETLLCHTQEFIGGRYCITTMMKARSSVGRNFIEVCKCAGWGDIGFVNRWTMEVTNNSRYYHVPLVVGRRLAQIVFFEVAPTGESYVGLGGKYQTTCDLEELKRSWKPEMMLPKMSQDREAKSILEGGD